MSYGYSQLEKCGPASHITHLTYIFSWLRHSRGNWDRVPDRPSQPEGKWNDILCSFIALWLQLNRSESVSVTLLYYRFFAWKVALCGRRLPLIRPPIFRPVDQLRTGLFMGLTCRRRYMPYNANFKGLFSVITFMTVSLLLKRFLAIHPGFIVHLTNMQ